MLLLTSNSVQRFRSVGLDQVEALRLHLVELLWVWDGLCSRIGLVRLRVSGWLSLPGLPLVLRHLLVLVGSHLGVHQSLVLALLQLHVLLVGLHRLDHGDLMMQVRVSLS